MINLKDTFLESQYWMMSIQAAFQRSGIYANVSDKTKEVFRSQLHISVKQIAEQYKTEISEDQHILNIQKLQEASRNLDLLKNGILNFGICQKLLNLYLKYLWCAGWIPTPPHFPIDRLIQERLGFKQNEVVSWTKDILTSKDYMKIIDNSKVILAKTDIKNLAELELEIYTHNNLKELMKLKRHVTTRS